MTSATTKNVGKTGRVQGMFVELDFLHISANISAIVTIGSL
jgi:hypothetical protein